MTASTPTYGFPYPEDTDAPDGPSQFQALATAVESSLSTEAAARLAADTSEAATRLAADNALDARLDIVEGAWTDYTPTLTQNAAITKTIVFARYRVVGKTVQVQVALTATAAGTAGQAVAVTLPVAILASTVTTRAIGSFWFNDAGTAFFSGSVVVASGAAVVFSQGGTSTGVLGQAGGGFTSAIASGDAIGFECSYETA